MSKYLVFHKGIGDEDWLVDIEMNFPAAVVTASEYQEQRQIAIICNVNVMAQIAKAIAEERREN